LGRLRSPIESFLWGLPALTERVFKTGAEPWVKTDGVMPTLETVRNKLDQPLALGYCNVGMMLEAGSG
jgi:hypothetical protein